MCIELAKEVWSEQAMIELLGCSKTQLRRLTLEGGLRGVRLQAGLYVYLAEDVRKWLVDLRDGSGPSESRVAGGQTTP